MLFVQESEPANRHTLADNHRYKQRPVCLDLPLNPEPQKIQGSTLSLMAEGHRSLQYCAQGRCGMLDFDKSCSETELFVQTFQEGMSQVPAPSLIIHMGPVH